jgi:hypothetical protein
MTNNDYDPNATRDALATIRALTECPTTPTPFTACAIDALNCIHTKCFAALRDLMIDADATPDFADDDPYRIADALHAALRDALLTLTASPYHRDDLTKLALDNSLCPMHFCDYAICFDDDDDECAAIRLIHPSHDT